MSEHPQPKKSIARRRRENVPGGRRHVHKVRVSPEEEARLVQLAAAQRVSVPRLLIEAALSAAVETPSERREAMAQLFALRRGLTGMASNVNQIARAANTEGRAPVGTAQALEDLRAVVGKVDVAIEGLAGS